MSAGAAVTRNVRPDSSETAKPAEARRSSERARSAASSGFASNVSGVRSACEAGDAASSLARKRS